MRIIIRSHRHSDPNTIDMTPDGRFTAPEAPPLSAQILRAAIVIAALAGTFALAALVLWFALMLIPVAIGAALIAYGAFRYRVWRLRRGPS